MLRINQIRISAGTDQASHHKIIKEKVAKLLMIDPKRINSIEIIRRSIDARHADNILYVYTVDADIRDEDKIRIKNDNVSRTVKNDHVFPYSCDFELKDEDRPVIIGMGPAGLFCAYMLAKAGFRPKVYERGKPIDLRTIDVKRFWEDGVLLPDSNVQFGEGGAGAFSDGKLNTLIKDRSGRNREVLRIFASHGADESIMYDSKPHIGTDKLTDVVKNIRESIISYGGEVYFGSKAEAFEITDESISGVVFPDDRIACKNVVLAVGHSARDTFKMLHDLDVPMEPKAFAVGFRVMHPQSVIDDNQYGRGCEYDLPVASYKLTHTAGNRGVYSFCMCPGGYVVNASSEAGMTAVNGMSYHDRDSSVANSAIVVQVTPDDFEDDGVLAGVSYQRKLERKAYELAKGRIPVQKYGDFKKTVCPGADCRYELELEPKLKGGYEYCELSGIMPQVLNECFVQGMEAFGRKIEHFNDGNTIMAGIESRTSSPVRILRDDEGMSHIRGLFPCGEGAGYAGGITSAAMDGIYIAEKIAERIVRGRI